MTQITQVPREEVPEIWPIVGPMIERAIAYTANRVGIIDVYADILMQNLTLWVAFTDESVIIGCAVVRIYDTPLCRCMTFEYLAGESVDLWLTDGLVVLNSYAHRMKCKLMDCRGRFGWVPRLKDLGWEAKAVFFEKEVVNPRKVNKPHDEEEKY